MAELQELIDLERHPIHPLDAAPGQALVARVSEQLRSTGAAELPGFLRPEVTEALAREATGLVGQAHRHSGKATPYLELPEPGWPEGHPRTRWNPFSLGAVPYDRIPVDSALRQIYAWEPLRRFVAACLRESELHRYADPLGCLSLNVMVDGDEVEWHFDQADFVVSIPLQDADSGGDFLYVPLVRSGDDESYERVTRVLDGDIEPTRIPMVPGSLLLFHGRHSIHCVSPTAGAAPRLVALLAYDTKPGTCASELLQKLRYGRSLQPGQTTSSAAARR